MCSVVPEKHIKTLLYLKGVAEKKGILSLLFPLEGGEVKA